MLTIYKNKNDIPQSMEYVELNDVFFNRNTVMLLDEQAEDIIAQIDETELIGKFKIASKFNGVVLDVDRLSTGCKTALNVFYFPEKVFCLKECGDNALEVLYQMESGSVYSDYALIPFGMDSFQVKAISGLSVCEIDDYEELKEWWGDEE